MAFAVVCKSCQARFLLNDDLLRRRVAGKVVTVRCRQCHAAIEVDGSDVDAKGLPQQKPEPAPPPQPAAPIKTMTFKPAPAPPRPVKSSTLMGIGGPPRPAGATELVALSPGLLNVTTAVSPTPPKATAHGFPEPPPPPRAVEELSSSDWEIPESSPPAKSAAAPESLDDFVEELPPSLPPPEEDVPSSTGTPSLKALTHHDEQVKPRVDDFFANMSAAMNGGMLPEPTGGAPTIDISTLSAPTTESSDVDMTALDVPLTGGSKTLPLFALGNDTSALLTAPAAPEPAAPQRSAAAAKAPSPSPAGGSLSPSAVDRPPSSQRPDGARERKNVVAPATKSVPPEAPARRRSGLAAPVLLALAAAAGFLIWKRSAPSSSQAEAEQPIAAAPQAVAPPEPAPAQPAAPVAATENAVATNTPTPAVAPADDVTFETTPTKAPAAVARDKAPSTPAAEPAVAKPAEPAAVAKPEPAVAPVKDEPPAAPAEPAPPAEPAGPFDRAAASAALTAAAAQASACRKDGDPSGVASVVITFAPSGRVTSANVSGPPYAGTPTGGCIASALRKAKVPAFDGDRVTVSKTVTIQ